MGVVVVVALLACCACCFLPCCCLAKKRRRRGEVQRPAGVEMNTSQPQPQPQQTGYAQPYVSVPTQPPKPGYAPQGYSGSVLQSGFNPNKPYTPQKAYNPTNPTAPQQAYNPNPISPPQQPNTNLLDDYRVRHEQLE